MNQTPVVYDIECYPNVFTLTAKIGELVRQYAICPWRNDIVKLREFMAILRYSAHPMVGFNNVGYDYPVLHALLNCPHDDWDELIYAAYTKSQRIFASTDDSRFRELVRKEDWLMPQVDLFLIHHFDNKARRTSLKALEFAMGAENIQDLPFEPGKELTEDQLPMLLSYNLHDVEQTATFLEHSKEALKLRAELTTKYGIDFTNFNDTKIGKEYFIMRLEEALPGVCYINRGRGRHPRQTERHQIALDDIIFSYIEFARPEFNAVLDWLRRQVITKTKGVFTELDRDGMGSLTPYCDLSGPKDKVKNLNCIIDGFRFDFGTGGIHGSVESQIVRSSEEWCVLDLDATAFYSSVAIVNRIFPEHLTVTFCDIYKDVYEQRKKYPKGTPENAVFKLALNGVYGDSNNRYSPFYDPQYTMSITINGQLLLCMLSEMLLATPDLRMIQINTDGVTVQFPRKYDEDVDAVVRHFEELSGLTMEAVEYDFIGVRDTNNYIAVSTSGKVKRKGAYEYKTQWHQDPSELVVPKVVEKCLLNSLNLRETLENHEPLTDFFCRAKVNRDCRLEWGGEEVQRISRYYVSKTGAPLVKIMPPLKGKENERRIGICVDRLVKICNDSLEIDKSDIDFDYYYNECVKLVKPLVQKTVARRDGERLAGMVGA